MEQALTNMNFSSCVQLSVGSLPKNLGRKVHNNWKNTDPNPSHTQFIHVLRSENAFTTNSSLQTSFRAPSSSDSPDRSVIIRAILGHQAGRLLQVRALKLLGVWKQPGTGVVGKISPNVNETTLFLFPIYSPEDIAQGQELSSTTGALQESCVIQGLFQNPPMAERAWIRVVLWQPEAPSPASVCINRAL